MTKRIVQALAVILITYLSIPALGASETLDIFGTTAANAQTNITKSGNQSVNVSAWNIGSGVKTFTINVTNTTDTFTITLHNITVGRLIEWRFNNSIANATQADTTGTIRFQQVQATGNRTYSLQPATNEGGKNWTFGWFEEWIWIGGQNLSALIPAATALTPWTSNISGANYTLSGADIRPNLINTSQNFTIGTDNSTILVDARLGTLDVTLPAASGLRAKEYTVKKKDATTNVVDIQVASSGYIDSAKYANLTLQDEALTLVSDGTEWQIKGNYRP